MEGDRQGDRVPTLLDSHTHAWAHWPYAPSVPDPSSRGNVEQLLFELDTHSVEQALVVCAAIDHNPHNLDYVAAACAAQPERLHMVADLDCSWSATYHRPGAPDRLRALAERYPLVGFAHYLADENDGWLRTAEADNVFTLASEQKLLVSLGGGPAWQADLRELARRHPDVPVLCHVLGGVRGGDGTDSETSREVLASAAVENIYLKVAGLHYCSARGFDYPWRDVLVILERLVEVYGPARLCWGSDFPAGTRYCTFRQALEAIRFHCPFLDEQARALILGETLRGLLSRAACPVDQGVREARDE